MGSENNSASEIPISPDILVGARDLLRQYSTDNGVDLDNLILKLAAPDESQSSNVIAVENSIVNSDFRLAKMGWIERNLTSGEVQESKEVVESIKKISRFGYQIASYVLTKQDDGSFSGMSICGMDSRIRSIWTSLESLKERHGAIINSQVSNCMDFDYLDTLDYDFSIKLPDIIQSETDRIVLIKQRRKNPDGAVSVLGVPAIEAEPYGYPPFTLKGDRYQKALQFIEFNSPENREKFEVQLVNHPKPLIFLNNIYSFLFSPDNCKNLIAVGDRKGVGFIIQEGQAVGYANNMEDALSDFAGFGFQYSHSETKGGNNKPLIV